MRIDETLDEAARRELEEEAGVTDVYLEQLYTFGALDRDPRERVVTVAYYALAKLSDHRIRAATDAMGVGWFALDDLPKLAFDHAEIVTRAHERLRGKVRYAPIGFELLPPRFSLTQLQRLYEIILGTDLDKRNFRKKILVDGSARRDRRGRAGRAPPRGAALSLRSSQVRPAREARLRARRCRAVAHARARSSSTSSTTSARWRARGRARRRDDRRRERS